MWKDKVSYDASSLDEILAYVEEDGGFNDIYFTAGRPIIFKRSGVNQRLGNRPLQKGEVNAFIRKITEDDQAHSVVMTSRESMDPSYSLTLKDEFGDTSKRFRYRVSIVRARDGFGFPSPMIVMRSITSDPVPLEKQMLEQEILTAIQRVRMGLIVIAGPTGSGKSTLLSGAILDALTNKNSSEVILTYEAPIEYVYEKVDLGNNIISQQEVNPNSGDCKSFSEGIRNALRRGPTRILVGESRDRETFEGVTKASNTGHIVYTTMHVNCVADIPNRVISEFPDSREARLFEFTLASRMWMVQILVPRKGGGRVPIREYLVLTQEIIDTLGVTAASDVRAVTQKLVEQHGQTMQASAKLRFEEGLISEDTYHSITGDFASGK